MADISTYAIQNGFNQHSDGPADIVGSTDPIAMGAGIVLAPSNYGLQIDSIIPSADVIAIASGAPTGIRLTVITGQAQWLSDIVERIPREFGRYFNASGSNVGERKLSAIAVFGSQHVALDFVQMSVLFPPAQKPLHFSARKGGGLLIPPALGAMVLATFYSGDDAAPGNTEPPYVGLTVCGSELTKDDVGNTFGSTPARFNNVVQPGTK